MSFRQLNMIKHFSIVLAIDAKGGIGHFDGLKYTIPFKSSTDLKHFKNTTCSTEIPNKTNVIIMGRKTYDSLQKELPNRINVVLSRNKDVSSYNNFEDTYEHFKKDPSIEKIFVIGGAELINSCLDHPELEYIYLSEFDKDYDCNIFCDNIKKYCDKIVWQTKCDDVTISKYTVKKHPEYQYINLIDDIIKNGVKRNTRNSNTYTVFGRSIEYNFEDGFPILTTKRVALRLVFEELMFFLRGQTDSKILASKKVHIWDSNTTREFLDKIGLCDYEVGTMGPMYGFNWTHFGEKYIDSKTKYTGGVNQLEYAMNTIKNDPYSRRIIMTTYDPYSVKKCVLYPCHGIVVQFFCRDENNKRYLDCIMYQRSCDTICGLPFNISSYGLLMSMICHCINNDKTYAGLRLVEGKLKIYIGDTHIYDEETHINAYNEHMTRRPKKLPRLNIKKQTDDITSFEWDDIELVDYDAHPSIKVNMIA
uniref:thymidylate synthase n=1 Tax=viral metagenome TaxID=1070528 RepID=A0A6C0ECS5_9ZZZZ